MIVTTENQSLLSRIYKDMILLMQGQNRLLTSDELKAKLDDPDMSTLNDQLLAGEKKSNDATYYERRCYLTNTHLIKFVFLTRCFSGQMRNELREIAEKKSIIPDVILLNSGKIISLRRIIRTPSSYLGYHKI